MGILTREMAKKYVESAGTACPFCGCDDVEGGFVEVDSGGAWQRIVCNGCARVWNDVYKLVDAEDDVYDNVPLTEAEIAIACKEEEPQQRGFYVGLRRGER